MNNIWFQLEKPPKPVTGSRRRTFISTLNTFIARQPCRKPAHKDDRGNKASTDQGSDEKAWLKILAKYRTPHAGPSVFELTVTAIPFAAFWMLTWLAVHFGFWWGLILIVPAAGFLLRLSSTIAATAPSLPGGASMTGQDAFSVSSR